MKRNGIMNYLYKFHYKVSGDEAQENAFIQTPIKQHSLLQANKPIFCLDTANAKKSVNLLKENSSQHGTTLILMNHSITPAKKMSVIY